MRQTNFIQKLTGLFLLITFLAGDFSAFAQTRRTSAAAGQTKKECNSGYSGTVSYTKIVSVISSGKFGSSRSLRREYTAQILVRDDGRLQGAATASADGVNGSFNLTGRATASATETLNQIDVSEKDEYCNVTIKGRGAAQRVRCEGTTIDRMQANGEGENATVFIGLRGRKMTLSIGNLPKLSGTFSRDSSTKCSGTCTPSKPLGSSSSQSVGNKGENSAATDDGVISFDPQNFNRLSGSWTRENKTGDGTTIETFQWNLSRCAPPLEIGDIRFEHKKVPNPDRWYSFDPKSGTIDGNIVKIKAKVYNNGGETKYANVKFSETKSGEQLPDAAVSVAVKPGEARDVEYEWDTNGFAWNDNQTKESEREIRAELEDGNNVKAEIKIKPKPVVMVHGLWANAGGWADYPIYLRNAHSYDWEGFAVGADPEHGKMSTGDFPGNYKPTNTIFQNAQELGKQIKYVRESLNAWHIDIVAHSMGGLISRFYINTFMQPVYDGKPEAAHLIMLGTPNQGSPCAYTVDGLFGMFGNQEMMAIKELRPYSVAKFNQTVTNRKGVKFSILAGYTVRTTCHEWGLGDGVVQLPSALYNISDRDYSRNIHTELTGKDDFQKFVLPRLAVGPKKARADRRIAALETDAENYLARLNESKNSPADRYGFNSYFQNASFKPGASNTDVDTDASLANLTTRQKVVLKPKESKEIEIPVRDGQNAGVLIVASYVVSATFFDEANKEIGKSIVDSPTAARELFRVINAERPIKNGIWRLKLENFDASEQTVYLAGWTNNGGAAASFTVEAGKPNAAGTVPLTAKWIENNSPVLNANITGKIVGQEKEIQFFDDGKHADGAAGDGVYGASVGKLPNGEYFVEATATANNINKLAVAPISVGAAKTTRRGK